MRVAQGSPCWPAHCLSIVEEGFEKESSIIDQLIIRLFRQDEDLSRLIRLRAEIESIEAGGIPAFEYVASTANMKSVRYVCWESEGMWLGHLEEFPDYITQGQTLEDLRDNLKDMHEDLASGEIPGVKRVAELQVP